MSVETGKVLPVKKLIIILLALLLFASAVFIAATSYRKYKISKLLEELTTDETADGFEDLPDNPVDFAALKEANDEIYAWISIPHTEIELPTTFIMSSAA